MRSRARAKSGAGGSRSRRRDTDRTSAGLPSPEALLAFLRDTPGASNVREIARAFRLPPADQPAFRAMLRTIERSGELARGGDPKFIPGAALADMLPGARGGPAASRF